MKIRTFIFYYILYNILLSIPSFSQQNFDSRISLIIGQMNNTVRSVNPFFFRTLEEKELSEIVYGRGIIQLDSMGEFTPGIISKFFPKESEWLFTINKNVFFHDGIQLTSNDIAFTIYLYKRLRNYKNIWYDYRYDFIKSVEVVDDFSLNIILKKPVDNFLRLLSKIPVLPEHKLKGLTDDEIFSYFEKSTPVGTGAFKVETIADNYIELSVFNDYYGKKSFIERIHINLYSTEEQLKKAFVTGDVDLIQLKDYKGAKDVSGPGKNIRVYRPDHIKKPLYFIAFNLNDPLFKFKKIRLALSYAINKQEILSRLSSTVGFRENAYSPVFSGSWAFLADVEKYEYNPQRSIHFLSEAGWKDSNGDGLLDNGRRSFTFELLFPKGYSFYEELVRQMQINLSEVGIQIIPVPLNIFTLTKRLENKKYQAALMYTFFDDDDITGSLRNFLRFDENNKSDNLFGYKNNEVFSNLLRAEKLNNKQQLKHIFERIQDLIVRDIPCTFLFFEKGTFTAFHTEKYRNYLDKYNRFLPFEYWEKQDFVQR